MNSILDNIESYKNSILEQRNILAEELIKFGVNVQENELLDVVVPKIDEYRTICRDSITEAIIPEDITEIPDYAYYNCTNLKTVNIHNSVTHIGEYAFYGCKDLIINYDGCNLEFSDIIDDVSYFEENNIQVIYSDPITYRIEAVSGGDISKTGYAVVESCKKEASGPINIKTEILGYPVIEIDAKAFNGCSSFTSITIPDSITSIGNYAFSSCSSLTSVTIGDSVTSIGVGAFSGCTELTSVHINDLNAWCNIDFAGNTSNPLIYAENIYLDNNIIEELTIPDGVTSIKKNAFYGCNCIRNLNLPNSITEIGNYAFRSCDSLTSITIPDSVTSIGIEAFADCDGVETLSIGTQVINISKGAFFHCTSLLTVQINSNKLEEIADTLFMSCENLKNINIPQNIIRIGDSAFQYCSSLKSIIIPPSVLHIDNNTFSRCNNLVINYNGCNLEWDNIEKHTTYFEDYNITVNYLDPITYTYVDDSKSEICISSCDKTASGLINIKSDILNIPVTSILEEAFWECKNIANVQIPDTITSIGVRAFGYCENLTELRLPQNAEFKTLSEAVFEYTAITDITIPDSITDIHKGAFYYCEELTNVIIPDSVINIGELAFGRCNGLESVTIPKGVQIIDGWAFSDCANLAKVIFEPSNCTTMGTSDKYVFAACNKLSNVIIRYGVTRIPDYAFAGCSAIIIISIPEDVKYIGSNTFKGCSRLLSVDVGWYVGQVANAPWGLTNCKITYARNNLGYGSYLGHKISRIEDDTVGTIACKRIYAQDYTYGLTQGPPSKVIFFNSDEMNLYPYGYTNKTQYQEYRGFEILHFSSHNDSEPSELYITISKEDFDNLPSNDSTSYKKDIIYFAITNPTGSAWEGTREVAWSYNTSTIETYKNGVLDSSEEITLPFQWG